MSSINNYRSTGPEDYLNAERKARAAARAGNTAQDNITIHGLLPADSQVTTTTLAQVDANTLQAASTINVENRLGIDLMSVASGFFATNEFGWVHHDNHKLWLQFPDAGRAVDATGNQQSGLIVGSPSLVPGILSDNGVALGSGKYIQFVDAASLRFGPTDQMTVCAWIKTSSVAAFDIIVSKRDNSINSAFNYQFFFNNNILTFQGDSGNTVSYASSLRDGKLHFVAATYNNGTGKIYSDGILRATNTGLVLTPVTHPVFIGRDTVGFFFNGEIYDPMIFNLELSLAQLDTIMNRGQLSQPFIPDFMECQVIA